MENLDKVTVIGIAGGTGSGKTTVVKIKVNLMTPAIGYALELEGRGGASSD